jgi:hypothetical protein
MFSGPNAEGSDEGREQNAEEETSHEAFFIVIIAFVFDYQVSFHVVSSIFLKLVIQGHDGQRVICVYLLNFRVYIYT